MGFISDFFARQKAKKQHSINKDQFIRQLEIAASDGKLTVEEIQTLESMKKEYGLTDFELAPIRVQVYNKAFASATSDRKITPDEEKELKRIQNYLELSDNDIRHTSEELSRLRLLNEINNGSLPTVQVNNLILQKSEVAHWSEPGNILEERVVRRRYEGGSRGVSFRICKGVSYRVGAHRGNIVSDTAVVPVSSGSFIITNKRIIFKGDKKSFNLKMDKLLGMEFYSDGIKIEEGTGKNRTVQFTREGNVDIVGAIMSRAINNYL